MNSEYCEDAEEDERKPGNFVVKKSNILPLWGNDRTMNLNPLILTNIQSSHYFKVNLYELKTYHEVIDEIYYKVSHLEPWEKGSRKTSGQTGMCGGVRGVGAGGIVSTAYCLLYKLFTLKLTRKQLNGLITHPDSPYIRALGFMYIRYTQPPADLWDWYEEYLEDPEELDVKAGGGQVMRLGSVLRSFLTKLEWFSTLFPRIPVPIQQKLEKCLATKAVVTKPAVAPVKARASPPGEQPVRHRSRSRESVREKREKSWERSDNRGQERRDDRDPAGLKQSLSRDRDSQRSWDRDSRDRWRGDRDRGGPRSSSDSLRGPYRDRRRSPIGRPREDYRRRESFRDSDRDRYRRRY